MAPPKLIIVGADKGGTGKTFTSRVLLTMLPADARIVDTETALSRFYPAATRIDPTRTDDQIRLFDDMPAVTLVDVRAGLMSSLLRGMGEMRLIEDAERGTLALTVLHVLGPNDSSLSEVTKVADLVGGAKLVLVKNHVSADAAAFQLDEGTARRYLGELTVIDLLHLDDRTSEAVDARGQTFGAFATDETNSGVLRRKVAHWLGLAQSAMKQGGLP